MADTKCKICRRAKQKLFLKEERCFGPKCTLVRKPYPPGKKSAKRPKPKSEYGIQLQEKQSLKFLYGLRERQFSNYVKKALTSGGTDISSQLLSELESRLDNTVYRLGFTLSRNSARQMVNHGHICVNNRRVSIPSAQVRQGDKISIRKESATKGTWGDLDTRLKKYNPPEWLKLDKSSKEAQVLKKPEVFKTEENIDLNKIFEFYSK